MSQEAAGPARRAGPVDPRARLSYQGDRLDPGEEISAPLPVLHRWYAEAMADERVAEPGAMVVATVGSDGLPNARTVLLKALDERGFVFFSNVESAKGRELATNPVASLVLLWHPMYRQIRARGPVERVCVEDAEEYFTSRPRDSQVAAWASAQSRPLSSPQALTDALTAVEDRFAGQETLPLPDFWGGYRVRPIEIELWVGQRSRLHDRWSWVTSDGQPALLDDGTHWVNGRLQP